MEDFKTRLLKEKMELDEKFEKLTSFLNSHKSDNIEDIQKALLMVQVAAMGTYSQCLSERIARL